MRNYKSLYHSNFKHLIKSENLEIFDIKLWRFFWKLEIPFYYYDKIVDKTSIPDEIKKLYKNQIVRNMVFLDLLKEFKSLLENYEIDYFLYKGIWLIENIYKLGVRSIDDIDILIKPNSLNKMKNLLEFWSVDFDRNFFNNNSYHETRVDIKKWRIPLFIDIHRDIVPFEKIRNFHDLFSFDSSNTPEKQFVLLLIELAGDFFKNEKRFIDTLEILNQYTLNWSFIIELIVKLKIKKQFVYLFFIIDAIKIRKSESKSNSLFNKRFYENFDFYKKDVDKIVKQSKIQYFFIKNSPIFNKKRVNQLLLPFLQSDSIIDYSLYFFKKTFYILKKGELWKEILKFKIELGEK
ncbi:nucleotidyltransferase family protein [bacterium]|nr:nucleotidyltransferase family protein [bacterium]